MIFFEQNLASAYQTAADAADTKEEKSVMLRHAEELEERIGRLQKLLEKPPKI